MTVPVAPDDRLADLVARILGEAPELVPTRPGQAQVGLTGRYAVYLAVDERTTRRLELEGERLAWGSRMGLPVPLVIDRGPGWLVTERVPDDGQKRGPAYVEAAIRAARAIELIRDDPPGLPALTPFRKPSRRMVAERTWRLLRGPVSLREFVELRRRVSRLPKEVLGHGDFHPKNVLFAHDGGEARVIDWEYVALAPRHSDLLMLWSRLEDPDDRRRVLDAVLETDPDRQRLALLHQWFAVRHVADTVTKLPIRQWPRERLVTAMERVAEATANATAWLGRPLLGGVSPRRP